MPTGGEAAFGGVLPLDDVEGDRAQLAGKLAAFAEALFRVVADLAAERTLPQWRDSVLACSAAMIAEDDDNFADSQVVRRALTALAGDASGVEFRSPVHRAVLCAALEARLGEERRVHEFMAGGVTFASMLPMRSIPFRAICLLGMNDDAFPRADLVRTFDKIAVARRIGDRSLRDEDRYLFLEALLSARDRVYISYVGRNIQDNSVCAPSVVVEELLDVLQGDACFVVGVDTEPQQQLFAETRAAREQIVLEHSLSAHAARYFSGEDPRLYSYSEVRASAALALAGPKTERPNAMLGGSAATDAAAAAVDLNDLCRYFDNPPRFLAERQLGIRLRRDAVRVEDREPIEPTALDNYFAGTFLLERLVAGDDAAQAEVLLRAQGALPIGELGRQVYAELLSECLPLFQSVAELSQGRRLPKRVRIETPHGALTGVVDGLFEAGQVHYGFGRVKGRRRLRLWLRHLALCAAGERESSYLVARGSPRLRHPALAAESAAKLLGALLALFHAGVARPLPFVPETGFAYAQRRVAAGGDVWAHEKALDAAKRAFLDTYGFGESRDEYVQLAFPDETLFTATVPGELGFPELSWEVFAPLLEHTEVGA
jgi:exodeoxyribonuclease V gamma subunit